jgi:hypothetical protein
MWFFSSVGFRCARRVAEMAGLPSVVAVVSVLSRDFRCQIRFEIVKKLKQTEN